MVRTTNYYNAVHFLHSALILCNEIVEIDESVIENCRFDFEDSDSSSREIFQWFLTDLNKGDVEWLEESFGLLFSYSEKLGLYILCVDHLGTHWDYVDCPCYNDEISDELLKRTSKDF